MNKNIIFVFFFSYSLFLSASFSIDCLKADRDEVINSYFIQDQKLIALSFDADFSIDERELRSLIGLQEGEFFSSKEIASAVFYLKQKARFNSIMLKVTQFDEGVKLLFQLTGNMIFSKVSVHGYITGKYKYKNAYILNEGDQFDISKHDHSIDNMRKMFRDNGYFNVKIKDHISYDYEKLIVSVDIYLERNSCCRIDAVILNIEGEGFDALELEKIKTGLFTFCCSRLKGKYCSKKVIEKYKNLIERFLYKRGLLYSQIDMKIEYSEHAEMHVLVELNRKKEFVFFGNHYFSRQDFMESLLLYGKSAWHFPAVIISDELRQMYHQKGFWDADISTSEEAGKMFCVINEGKRVRVVGIEYQGVEAFSDEELHRELAQDQIVNKLFDKKTYDAYKQKILDVYKSHGYWDAFIEKEEFQLMYENKEHCMVSLLINEGKPRMLRSISVPGYEHIEKELQSVFSETVLIPFNYSFLADQKNNITLALKERGFTHIDISYQLNETADGIDLVWNIQGDNSIKKFGKAVLVSNAVVSYEKLSREFMFKKGDDWDLKKLDKTAVRLRELGIFDSVQVYPAQACDYDGEQPVLIKVVDADKYEARCRFGLQQVGKNLKGITHKIGGSFLVNNPLKIGDKIFLDADFTQYYGKFSARYVFPWLFRLPIRSEIQLYNNYYKEPVYFGSDVYLYRANKKGLLLGAGRSFEKYSCGLTSGFDFVGIKEVKGANDTTIPIDIVLDYSKDLVNKTTTYFYLEPSLVLHRLDNILNPTSGYRSLISCKAMFDFDTKTSFFKLIAEQSFYAKIMPRAVLAVKGRIGHVFNQEFSKLSPIERFYLGGVNSIRGYFHNYCPPFGLLPDPIEDARAGLPEGAKNMWKYAPQGGRTSVSLNAEVRLNLYKQFDAAFFTDLGVLFKDTIIGKKENLVAGSGCGLRYNTPVGPIRFDIAWKWKIFDKDFEPAYIWYLTLGQAF